MKATCATILLAAALSTPAAYADGLPVAGLDADNIGVGDENARYVVTYASPDTIVEKLDRRTGRGMDATAFAGRFTIPVVAYDGSPDGLSADGKTLVLIAPRSRFPRARTTFAVLGTERLLLRRKVTLRGDYSFDAISPDGRLMYLIHYTSPRDAIRYEVLALDLRTGRLRSRPIVDPREPGEKMNGRPLTRAASADGRWAYTLYDGTEHPFVHALDTVARDARCIDLDWLTGRETLPRLRFDVRRDGRELALREPGRRPIAVVDTRTFAASAPRAAGTGSWPKTTLSALALLGALATLGYVVRMRRRSFS